MRAPLQALYNTSRWRALRKRQLQAAPLCAACLKDGRVTPATVADHVVPHEGDEEKFYDPTNLQSLCDYRTPFNCHGAKTSREANAKNT